MEKRIIRVEFQEYYLHNSMMVAIFYSQNNERFTLNLEHEEAIMVLQILPGVKIQNHTFQYND